MIGDIRPYARNSKTTAMKKAIILTLGLLTCLGAARANDGVYFTSGNFLVPVQETDIAAAREVLTITIGTDGFASVDVRYEFMNNGGPKTVRMAFEANSQYNDNEPLDRGGIHPYIRDFSVCMNGETLPYSNGVVAFFGREDKRSDAFIPLDPDKWKGYGEVPDSLLPASDLLYNAELDSLVSYAYAYYFDAPFRQGLNTVHHSYRYRMSYNVSQKFTIPYWLTPVTRWANRQVDDFTLRIKSEDITEFCLPDSLFSAAPFTSEKGREIYHLTSEYGESFIFTTIFPDDTVVWHCTGFRPTSDMCISSPEWGPESGLRKYRTSAKVVIDADGHKSRYIAESGDNYFVEVQDYALVPKAGSRLEEYSAENGQGCLVINGDAASRVNVRRRPTAKSPVIRTVRDIEGELPGVYPCLGMVMSDDGYMWYKARVNGRTGYIRQDLMLWDAIDSY